MNDYEFGNTITTFRLGCGFSQYQLGKLLGVSDKAVSKWENGKAKPRLSTCKKMAELFGVTIAELFGENAGVDPDGFTPVRDALWKKVYAKFHEQFGERPPLSFIARLESEKAVLASSDLIIHLGAAARLAEEARKSNELVIPRVWVSNYLTAWLLGATFVNPLPPYARCLACGRITLHPEADDGWDLPEEYCSCGAVMEHDGHNISFEVFSQPLPQQIDLNLPPSVYPKVDEILHDYYRDMFWPVWYDYRRDGMQGTSKGSSMLQYMLFPPESSAAYPVQPEPHLMDMEEIHKRWDNHFLFNFICYDVLDVDCKSIASHDFGFSLAELQMPAVIQRYWEYFQDKATTPDYDKDDDESVRRFWEEQAAIRQSVIKAMQGKQLNFNTLCRCEGLVHSSGVWTDNGEALLLDGTATLDELIVYREDVWNAVVRRLADRNITGNGLPLRFLRAARLGEYARKGMDDESRRILQELGFPEWYISHISKVLYLFPKGHNIAFLVARMKALHDAEQQTL